MMSRAVFFHVDIDSPKTLLRFWGFRDTDADLDRFYDIAMNRALGLFKRLGVPATFFCVGSELESSVLAKRVIQEAHKAGHEIANHTYTHSTGLAKLTRKALSQEIALCSDSIERVIGERPAGFRAPSYEVSNTVLDILKEQGFLYDSSAAWNSLQPFMKIRHLLFSKNHDGGEFGEGSPSIPQEPYCPSSADWKKRGGDDGFLEIPLPRSAVLKLPFYNNFHLMTGDPYRRMSVSRMRQSVLVYLIHLIEFVDLSDGLPAELKVHPNLSMDAERKIRFLEQTMRMLMRTYCPARSDQLVKTLKKSGL